MAIDAVNSYQYNPFLNLTGVKAPQGYETEKIGQFQINPQEQKPIEQKETYQGIDELTQAEKQGYNLEEINSLIEEETANATNPYAINYIFAQKPANDDGELSPAHDGFAIYS